MASAQSKIDPKSISTKEPVMQKAEVDCGREICGALEVAEQREWLVTNGIGGFASGTVSGNLTRRYHGLLVAAPDPPVVWMQYGENTTYVRYTLLRGSGPLELQIKAFVNYRDFHSSTHAGDWRMNIAALKNGVEITAFEGATAFYLLSAQASVESQQEWYRDCFLLQEKYRGLDDREDHLLAAVFRATLEPNQSVLLVFSTNAAASVDAAPPMAQESVRQSSLLAQWSSSDAQAASAAPGWIRQLVLAADQFIVKRPLPEEPDGRSIIAGYHWFADWGRDTMIALPGLTLTTGRADIRSEEH